MVRCVPLPRPLPSTAGGAAAASAALAVAGASHLGDDSLPLDWAHLHVTAGITHFAALPLYHGSTLAGALTILGCNTMPDALIPIPQQQQHAPPQGTAATACVLAALSSINGAPGTPLGGLGLSACLATLGSNGGPVSTLDSLFRAPLSLELVAMAVAQCFLGADMALARHAVEMVQAMHACASIQQLVAGISVGLQALMQARFCLTLRCNIALAVEFQPNAIMFEESPGGPTTAACQQPTGSGSQNNWASCDVNPSGTASRVNPGVTGRPSVALSSPAHTPEAGRRDAAHRVASGGLGTANGDGGAGAAAGGGPGPGTGRGPYNSMRSGVDTTGEPMWCASSGHVTASALLNQIVGRRYKVRTGPGVDKHFLKGGERIPVSWMSSRLWKAW